MWKIQKTVLTLALLWVFLAPSLGEKSDFFYTLLANENICFEEMFNKELGVHVNVKCPTRWCSLRIYDRQERQLFYKEREAEMDFSFTTTDPGNYKVCLLNYANTYTQAEVNIRSGVDAKNYDSLVTQKKLKPIELQAEKIKDFAKDLKKGMKNTLRAERELKRSLNEGAQTVNSSSYWTIGFMVVVTGLSMFILRTYFNKKKKM